MCRNPARTFGLPGKGTLEPGTDADLVLFDPTETYTISATDNASVVDYSIYEGREVTGRVKRTYLRANPSPTRARSSANPATASSFTGSVRTGAATERAGAGHDPRYY